MLTVDYDRLGVRAGHRLLDLGCGGGRHTFEALRRGALVAAVDRNAADLTSVQALAFVMVDVGEIRPDLEWGVVNGDALTLPFADHAFDRVIVSEVLEHIPDDTRALQELARVMRPGGRIAVTVPTEWPERICWALDRDYHDQPGGHVRIYRRSDLEERITAAGFAVQGSAHAHAFHTPLWWLRCGHGTAKPDNQVTRWYRSAVEWEMTRRPRGTRLLEALLNPLLGKSLVVYAHRT